MTRLALAVLASCVATGMAEAQPAPEPPQAASQAIQKALEKVVINTYLLRIEVEAIQRGQDRMDSEVLAIHEEMEALANGVADMQERPERACR